MNSVRYLTPDDIAQLLQISPRTVLQAIRKAEIRCVRIGNRVRVAPDEVAAWLAKKGGQR